VILRKSMFRAVVVFAIVTPEGKIDLDCTPLALQTLRLLTYGEYLSTPYF